MDPVSDKSPLARIPEVHRTYTHLHGLFDPACNEVQRALKVVRVTDFIGDLSQRIKHKGWPLPVTGLSTIMMDLLHRY